MGQQHGDKSQWYFQKDKQQHQRNARHDIWIQYRYIGEIQQDIFPQPLQSMNPDGRRCTDDGGDYR